MEAAGKDGDMICDLGGVEDSATTAVERRDRAIGLDSWCVTISYQTRSPKNHRDFEQRSMMNAIKAKWINGQILPAEPVDWPEGSDLLVEPIVPNGEKIGLTEEAWRDDPDSVAAWIAAVEKIEPLIWAEGERESYEAYREECRQINLEAVRKKMEEMPGGEAP